MTSDASARENMAPMPPVIRGFLAETAWRESMNELAGRKRLPFVDAAAIETWNWVEVNLHRAREAWKDSARGGRVGRPKHYPQRGLLAFAYNARHAAVQLARYQDIWERVRAKYPDLELPAANVWVGGELARLFSTEAKTWAMAERTSQKSYRLVRALVRAETDFKLLHARNLGIPTLAATDVTAAYEDCLARGRRPADRKRVAVLARLFVAQQRTAHLVVRGSALDAGVAWRGAAVNMRRIARIWARRARLAEALFEAQKAYLKVSRDVRFERLPVLYGAVQQHAGPVVAGEAV